MNYISFQVKIYFIWILLVFRWKYVFLWTLGPGLRAPAHGPGPWGLGPRARGPGPLARAQGPGPKGPGPWPDELLERIRRIPQRIRRLFLRYSGFLWKSRSTVAQFWAGCTKYQPEISILDPICEGSGNWKNTFVLGQRPILEESTANSGGVNGQFWRNLEPEAEGQLGVGST